MGRLVMESQISEIIFKVLSFAIGYLPGSILTANPVARHYTGKSACEIGTKNPGMANIMMNVGKGAGILVLLGDIVKTAAAMLVSLLLFHESIGIICIQYAALGALFGHNFSLWNRFRGGKGVTVTCTWLILAYKIPGILCCLAGAAAVFLTGWLPLGAAIIAVLSVPMAFFLYGYEAGILVSISCVLMIFKNRKGLRRILQGREERHLKLFGR